MIISADDAWSVLSLQILDPSSFFCFMHCRCVCTSNLGTHESKAAQGTSRHPESAAQAHHWDQHPPEENGEANRSSSPCATKSFLLVREVRWPIRGQMATPSSPLPTAAPFASSLLLAPFLRLSSQAVKKMGWFLTTGNGGAKARPRKVIRAFMYQVRRCQRAAREWLACRAARFADCLVVVASI